MNRKSIIIVISVVIMLTIIAVPIIVNKVYETNRRNDELSVIKVSEDFLEAVRNKRYTDAVHLLSSDGKKQYNENILKEYKVPELKYKGKPEIVSKNASVVMGDKEIKKYAEVTLIKENKKWLIYNFKIYILDI